MPNQEDAPEVAQVDELSRKAGKWFVRWRGKILHSDGEWLDGFDETSERTPFFETKGAAEAAGDAALMIA